MKNCMRFLFLAAIVCLYAPLAKADPLNQISFTGSDSADTSGNVTFNAPLTTYPGYGNAQVSGVSTGIFSQFFTYNPLVTASNNVYVDFMNFSTKTIGSFVLFTAETPSGQTLSFTVTSQTVSNTPGGPTDIGTGYYTLNGVVVQNGSFDMTTQNGMNISFSDTNSVTPEPSSLVLLGTGLVGAAGMLLRRRRGGLVTA